MNPLLWRRRLAAGVLMIAAGWVLALGSALRADAWGLGVIAGVLLAVAGGRVTLDALADRGALLRVARQRAAEARLEDAEDDVAPDGDWLWPANGRGRP